MHGTSMTSKGAREGPETRQNSPFGTEDSRMAILSANTDRKWPFLAQTPGAGGKKLQHGRLRLAFGPLLMCPKSAQNHHKNLKHALDHFGHFPSPKKGGIWPSNLVYATSPKKDFHHVLDHCRHFTQRRAQNSLKRERKLSHQALFLCCPLGGVWTSGAGCRGIELV